VIFVVKIKPIFFGSGLSGLGFPEKQLHILDAGGRTLE
jgi:hypothetical protein